MDIQVEHIDGHSARLTVTVDAEVTDKALQKAAKTVSKKYRIPGFRPGKAPYHLVLKMFGKEQLADEAIEEIVNEVYPAALTQSQVNPAAPGQLESYGLENEQLVVKFNVPKATEVDLGDYRSIRQALEIKTVTDEVLAEALENLRQSRAVVEEVQREAQIGDEVHGAFKVIWWHDNDDHDHEDGEEHDHDHEDGEEHDHDHEDDEDHDHDHAHQHEHVVIDEPNATIVIWEDETKRNQILPGVSDGLVGIVAGETRNIITVVPEDSEDVELRGKTLEATFTATSVHARTVAALDDAFAATLGQEGVTSLAELQVKMREDLEKASEQTAKNRLMDQVMGQLTEQAQVTYHPAALNEYIQSMIQNLSEMLEERIKMPLKQYLSLMGQTENDLAEQYHDEALAALRRDTVILKVLDSERIVVLPEEVTAEVERIASSYGDQTESWRSLLDTEAMRRDIIMRLLNEKLLDRVVAIATGQAPDLETLPDPMLAVESATDSPQ